MTRLIFSLLLLGCSDISSPTRCKDCRYATNYAECVDMGGELGEAGTGPTCQCIARGVDVHKVLECYL